MVSAARESVAMFRQDGRLDVEGHVVLLCGEIRESRIAEHPILGDFVISWRHIENHAPNRL